VAQVNTSNCLAQVCFVADLQQYNGCGWGQDDEKEWLYQAIQIKFT